MRAALSLPDTRLRLIAGLSSISAGFLWLWVAILSYGRGLNGPLCGEADGLLGHCSLCYSAALATVVAAAAWTARLRRA